MRCTYHVSIATVQSGPALKGEITLSIALCVKITDFIRSEHRTGNEWPDTLPRDENVRRT